MLIDKIKSERERKREIEIEKEREEKGGGGRKSRSIVEEEIKLNLSEILIPRVEQEIRRHQLSSNENNPSEQYRHFNPISVSTLFCLLLFSRDLIKKLLVPDRTRRLGNMKVKKSQPYVVLCRCNIVVTTNSLFLRKRSFKAWKRL